MGKKKHKKRVVETPVAPRPVQSTTIRNVYANTTGTDRPFAFVELGRDNVTIADCTIFGPDPALQTLVRSWARRQWWVKAIKDWTR